VYGAETYIRVGACMGEPARSSRLSLSERGHAVAADLVAAFRGE
jgi:hypothetical protein